MNTHPIAHGAISRTLRFSRIGRISLLSVVATAALSGQSPTGYWSFNSADIDIPSSTAFDRSGSNLNGTISNATSVSGIIREALRFNGTNASVVIPNDGSLTQLTTDLTLATWIKTSTANRNEAIISKYEASGLETGYLLHTTLTGTVGVRLGGNNTPSTTIRETRDTTPINDNQWHHVAVVLTMGQGITFYVDGTFSSTWPVNIVSAATASPFYFGVTDYASYANHLTGSLDEVYLFRQALTPAQVFNLYASSAAGPGTVISNVQESNLGSTSTTISWNTSTASDTQIGYGTTIAYGKLTPLSSPQVTTHTVNLVGLQPATQYHFRVQSRDALGVLVASSDATFTTQAQNQATNVVVDTTVSDFSQGTGANTYVAQMADGEVILAPAVGTEFSGNSLPQGWTTAVWQPGGTATVGNGFLTLSAAALFGPLISVGSSIEYVATYTQDPDEHIGFAVDLKSAPWAIFSTQSNSAMNIRTNNGSTSNNQLISGSFNGAPHKYRIDWTNAGFIYSIDDVQVGTHTIPVAGSMNAVVSNNFLTNGILNVDWLHVTPYATSATFTSRVLDANVSVGWSSASWTSTLPVGTSLAMAVRIGNTPVPDGSWTPFQAVAISGNSIAGSGRYIQYQAVLGSSNNGQTPVLSDVTLQYSGALSNISASGITPNSATITWTSNTTSDTQVNYGTTIGYGTSTPLNLTPVTSHSVPLTGLSASTLYHFQVRSNDGTAVVLSGDYTFTTPAVPDLTAPNVAITAPPAGPVAGQLTLVANATDNVGVVGVQFLVDNAAFGAEVLTPQVPPSTYQIAWDSSSVGNGPHTVSATARDAAGNAKTAVAIGITVANPTVLNLTDTTVADFSAGTGSKTYISMTTDGEVIQQPAYGTEFSSTPVGWTLQPWSTGGTVTVSQGAASVDGGLYRSGSSYSTGTSLQFTATFSGDPYQHAGFGVTLQSQPWAIFSTADGGTTLYIRTNNGLQNLITPLVGSFVGSPHLFRIDWTANGFNYFIDGVQVGSHQAAITQSMMPVINDYSVGGGRVTVDWLRLSPYATPATFTSRVFDSGMQVGWNALAWDALVPTGTALAMSYRIGNTPIPDGTWTAFAAVASSGGSINGSTRYIQYQAVLSSTDPTQTAALQDVTIQYNTVFSNIQATNISTTGATIGWTTSSASTSQVEFGTSASYGTSFPVPSDPTAVTTHSVSLTALSPNTLYHYRVKSNDGVLLNVSSDNTFTTLAVPDLTAPTISMTAPATGPVTGLVSLSANAGDNVGVVRVQFLLNGVNLGPQQTGQGVGPASYSIQWDSTTVPNATYTLSATAWDAANNHTTSPVVSVTVSNPVLKTITDTTLTDFSGGSGANFYVSQMVDGELILNPIVGTEFTTFPAGWTANAAAGGSVTLSGSSLAVDGALLSNTALFGPGRSLEFTATFGSDASTHVGFAVDLQSQPWALFSTFTGGVLYARTNNGTQSNVTLIPGSFVGTPHKYRIDWTATDFVYWIDGVQVLSDPVAITTSMRPMASDATPGGTNVSVDWIHLTPYVSSATFTSRVLDANFSVGWLNASWTSSLPTGTSLAMSVRIGNTPTPDGTWTAFQPVAASGNPISGSGRYAQYMAVLGTTNASQTPVLFDVTLQYSGAISNIAATNITTTSASITWTTNTPASSKVNYGLTASYGLSTPLDATMVTSHSVPLSGLTASTLYHYQVVSNDGVIQNASGDTTFTTLAVPDLTPPTISMTAPAAGNVSGLVTVSATASDNVGVVSVQFLLNGVSLGAVQAGQGAGPATYSIQWDSTTVPSTSYTLSAIAKDAANNPTTATAVTVNVINSIILKIKDTTTADFSAGTGTNFYISQAADGEVIQSPALGAEFTNFPAGWTASAWLAGGAATLNSGLASVDGALLSSNAMFGPGRSLEFVATFGGDSSEHFGFGTDFSGPPWAIFTTYTGGVLYARSNNGSQSNVTLIPGSFVGTPHKYRIDWMATGFVYWIDGVQVLSDPVPIAVNMRPLISDYAPGGTGITVDWVHLSAYAASATFTSRVIDAGAPVNWTSIAWTNTLPVGTSLILSVREGNTPIPDGTWTAFSAVATSGGSIAGKTRYLQYQVQLASSDPSQSAVLNDVTASYVP